MRPIALLVVCATWIAGPTSGASRLNPSEKRAMILNPAVVLISVKYRVSGTFRIHSETIPFEREVGSSGTGFIYRPDGYIITNGHVVADANLKDVAAQEALKQNIRSAVLAGVIIPEYRDRKRAADLTGGVAEMLDTAGLKAYYNTPVLSVFLASGAEFRADIKAYSDPVTRGGKDVAILKINGVNLPTVKLGDSNNVHVQEPITVIGYPGAASSNAMSTLSRASNLVPTVTNGHVSAVKAMVEQSPVIQSDAVVGHGNSGGPAFNDANEVIGITTFGSQQESGFNFFVPINTAMEFVNSTGAKQESGLFNQLWSSALDAYDDGKCQSAKTKLQSVLNIMPNEPDALRLMAASEKCIVDEGVIGRATEGSNWIIYSAGAVVIAAAAFLILARKRPGAAVAVASGQQVLAGGPGGGARVEAGARPQITPAAERSFGNIQVTAGSLSGKRFNITKAGLLVGSDASKCQIVLNEDTVSHEHAWIVPVDNSVVVIDRGSTNGTYINSVESPRVSKVGLQNGDRVYLGKKGSVVLTYFSS